MKNTDKKANQIQRNSITIISFKSAILLLLLLVLSGSTSAMSEAPSAAVENNERLLLQDASTAERDGGTVHQLDMSSGAASISLGPVVVNEDGTQVNIVTDGAIY
jgi:hypothetical protein